MAHMRMGVILIRHAMSCPARVGNADLSHQPVFLDSLFEHGDFTYRAQAFDGVFAVQDCNTGGVIAAVFETFEPLKQDRNNATLANGTDNTTHIQIPRESLVVSHKPFSRDGQIANRCGIIRGSRLTRATVHASAFSRDVSSRLVSSVEPGLGLIVPLAHPL